MSYLYVSEQGASIGIEVQGWNDKKYSSRDVRDDRSIWQCPDYDTLPDGMFKTGSEYPVLFHKRGVLWKADLNFPCECAKTAYSGGNWTQ